jgi:alkanesulfonate monooxygenase SsuD/methylene tetrahydromethanopterin reductase-like flavin-dependent oxidoreductase (luciferase family)
VAKSVGTAAVLSGGRISLGIGVGWCREEFAVLEQEFGNRGRRTDEALTLIRRLWEPGVVDFDGEFWTAPPMTMEPTPLDPVPIYVGGLTDIGFARAARHDGWVGDICTIEQAGAWAATLQAKRAEIGADGPFAVIVGLTDAVSVDDFCRAAALGITETMTVPWAYYHPLHTSLPNKINGMERFAADIIAPLAQRDPSQEL